ncbi:MAG TPA: NADP-dependent isocitrate dehydrogenase [Longilinea sp.]|nr:NADP-dependent isocitrate dehydrogenase [Longilinea sp.]
MTTTSTRPITPAIGQKIYQTDGHLQVPSHPIIPFIEGDGSGPDIWRAARRVIDAAVYKAYGDDRALAWMEVYAGEKAQQICGTSLPAETLTAFKEYLIGIKGPLGTPVGEGARSLNVALRQELDLYVCLRPVRWLPGTPSPVRHPELVNMVVFRENTEDLYAGIEFEAGTEETAQFKKMLREHFPDQYGRMRFADSAGIGIKLISKEGSQRLVRAAIEYALQNRRKSVTLVHKGNIMKYTEGAFRKWGYELARTEFAKQTYTWLQWQETKKRSGEEAANAEMETALKSGRLLVKDVIADAAFETALTRPQELDVLATPNLNGDYLSDALSAQVGGLGIAPGANINYASGAAIFEATHGTAPLLAGLDKANPCSLLLSAGMLLNYIGWTEAANRLDKAIEATIRHKTVTFDLAHLMEGATQLSTSAFGDAVIAALG